MHPVRKALSAVPEPLSPLLASKEPVGKVPEAGLRKLKISRKERRQSHQRNEDRFFVTDTKALARWRRRETELTVVNISSNGIMVETDRNADIGERVSLQLTGCNPITCKVLWARDGRLGLLFLDETEIIADAGVQDLLLQTITTALGGDSSLGSHSVGRERRGREKRNVRVWEGRLWIAGNKYAARLRNISSSGAMVALDEPVGDVTKAGATLDLGYGGYVSGVIAWASDYELGIQFNTLFDLTNLVERQAPRLTTEMIEEARLAGRGGFLESRYHRPRDDFDPYRPAEIEYTRLTLEEVYATLYPNGRPETASSDVNSPE